jgi:hypothetical protein
MLYKKVKIANVVKVRKERLQVNGVDLTDISDLNYSKEELEQAALNRKKQFSRHLFNMLVAGAVFKTDANLAKLTGVLNQVELLEIKRLADAFDNFYNRRLLRFKTRNAEGAKKIENGIEGSIINQASAMSILMDLNLLDDDMLCDFLEDLSKLIFKYNKKNAATLKKQNLNKEVNDNKRVRVKVQTP